MFRIALRRTTATAVAGLARSRQAPSARLLHPQRTVRFESTAPKSEFKQAVDELRRDWDAKVVSYEELKPLTLQPSPDKYLIDVREPDEVRLGSIPSAVNLPLSVLSGSLHLDPVIFQERFGFQKPGRDQDIVFYCRSGKRAFTACDIAKRNGYTKLANYEGSWLDWTAREGTGQSS
ncbi:uncharacterized protein FIBRA_04278 [Fibroporia radiculosa]|uniref:Rhodanese domain-containing protein n=1 Tax=Fibroporia radiculosa TaxID=599839 RepID=J4G745_9APHY|nr:uncharacterized protein FIBRA_04278 [Fibroporia radiculosa]CCM02198.1 predicted protein [Fibroporia radiculosa]